MVFNRPARLPWGLEKCKQTVAQEFNCLSASTTELIWASSTYIIFISGMAWQEEQEQEHRVCRCGTCPECLDQTVVVELLQSKWCIDIWGFPHALPQSHRGGQAAKWRMWLWMW